MKPSPAPTAVDHARASLIRATADRDDLRGRITLAEAQHASAGDTFDRSVRSAPADAPLSDHADAAHLVQLTEAAVAALRRGLPACDAVIASANLVLADALDDEAQQRWRVAIIAQLQVAREADELGKQFARLVQRWRDASADVNAAWHPKQPLEMHHAKLLRDIAVVSYVIPAELQGAITNTGSPHVMSLEAMVRSTWRDTVNGGLP